MDIRATFDGKQYRLQALTTNGAWWLKYLWPGDPDITRHPLGADVAPRTMPFLCGQAEVDYISIELVE